MKESDLYLPVVKVLEKYYQCDKKMSWYAGCGKDISFPSGFGKRKPDVVGIKRRNNKYEIHLVEGKLLNVPTHGFEETINQLDNLNTYSDFLWAVFPKKQWDENENNHLKWESALKSRGYGLLLYQDNEVIISFPPAINKNMIEEAKNQIIKFIFGETDDPIYLNSLSIESAITAQKNITRIVEVFEGPIKEISGKKNTLSFYEPFTDMKKPYFVFMGYQTNKYYIQGDPFSTYLNDGRALIWIWKDLGSLSEDEKYIDKLLNNTMPLDTYYFADNDNWSWICQPISELNIIGLKENKFIGEFAIGRYLSISGRSNTGIKKDLKELINWANKLD